MHPKSLMFHTTFGMHFYFGKLNLFRSGIHKNKFSQNRFVKIEILWEEP